MRTAARSIVFATAVLAIAGAAGGATPAASTGKVPDISGVWGARFVQSINENPPFLPEAKKRFDTRNTDDDPLAHCKPPGIPRLMNLNFPFEIVQTPKVVYFLMEYDQHVRRVYIDGKHPENPDPTWHGHSIGRWEGRTLIVDTVGFNEETWLDMRGHQHSDALHIIERYTLSDDGKSLQHEVTIDDPKVYSKPWAGQTKSHQRRPDMQIQEFICET